MYIEKKEIVVNVYVFVDFAVFCDPFSIAMKAICKNIQK